MRQITGQDNTGKALTKIIEKTGIWEYNPFPAIEYALYDQFIFDALEPMHFNSACIISTTVPWNMCRVLSNFFDVPTTILGKHPSLFLVENELKFYKNITLNYINIFTKEVNTYIEQNDLIIIHDYQYMLPIQYLPYNLKDKNVLVFSCDRRFAFDEQINQNFDNLTVGNNIRKLELRRETHYCSKILR